MYRTGCPPKKKTNKNKNTDFEADLKLEICLIHKTTEVHNEVVYVMSKKGGIGRHNIHY